MPARTTNRGTRRSPAFVEEPTDSIARRTFVSLWVALGFVATLWFLFQVREVLVWLFIALVLALALAPLVGWLTDRGLRRGLASFIAAFVVVLAVAGLLSAAGTSLVAQGAKLINSTPQIIDDVTKNQTLQHLDAQFHLVDKAKEIAQSVPTFFTGAHSPILETAKSTFNAVVTSLVIFTLAFFMLLEGPESWERFTALLRPRDARRVDRVGRKISAAVGGYVSGNLLISLIAGAVSYVTMLILGVPYAFPLAVLLGVLDLIPMVGATIAMIFLTLVALSVGWVQGLVLLAALVVYQQVENNVLQPIIYARTVQLSPLLILIATVTGGVLGGIVGVLLAIPAASAAQIIIIELLRGTDAGRRAKVTR